MQVSDFLIIYLSIGAPILVAYIVTKRCTKSLSSVAYAVAVLTLWPLFACLLLYQKYGRKLKHMGSDDSLSRTQTRNSYRIHIIQNKIEKIIRSGHRPSEIYRWRSDFDRYVNVLLSLSDDAQTAGSFELIGVTGHPDPDIANACHGRRIVARLLLQMESSRDELLRVSRFLCSTPDDLVDVEQLLLSLALLLNDQHGEADIRRAFADSQGQNPLAANVSEIGSDLWQQQMSKM